MVARWCLSEESPIPGEDAVSAHTLELNPKRPVAPYVCPRLQMRASVRYFDTISPTKRAVPNPHGCLVAKHFARNGTRIAAYYMAHSLQFMRTSRDFGAVPRDHAPVRGRPGRFCVQYRIRIRKRKRAIDYHMKAAQTHHSLNICILSGRGLSSCYTGLWSAVWKRRFNPSNAGMILSPWSFRPVYKCDLWCDFAYKTRLALPRL